MSAGQSSTAAARRLRQLQVVKEASQNVHIILVPEFLLAREQGITIHCYDHGIPLDESFEWEKLNLEGLNLLAALHEFQARQVTPQPIIFVCHSLGGSILKQAINIANIQWFRYSELISMISGIVFLGTPHHLEGVDIRQFGERVSSILKFEPGSNLSRQTLTKLKDVANLASIAKQFNLTNLRVDILSVYEKRVTRIRDAAPLLSRTRKIIIVDRPLCSISTQTEQTLGADLDHLQLPSMCEPDGSIIAGMRVWLTSVIADAPNNVRSRLLSGKQAGDQSSTSSSSSSGLDLDEAFQALSNQTSTSLDSPTRTSTQVNIGSDLVADMQAIFENFSIAQTDPRVPCFMMDTFVRNRDFFGRQEILKELDDCLLPSTELLVSSQPDRVRVGLLYGMGGLGKTETAIEYAYSRETQFDAIFWVRADVDQHDDGQQPASKQSSKLESDLAQIAVRLGIQDPNDPHNKAINKANALEWLCNPFKMQHNDDNPGRVAASWLLIFDNADSPEVLEPYSDIAVSGAVLITSRDPNARTSLSLSTKVIGIKPFDTKDAGEFVQRATGIEDHLDQAEQVGARLGGLPLALAQMAGIIRLEYLSYLEFLELYEDREEEVDIQGKELQPLRKTARGNISTIWALEKLSDAARAILEVSSFMDPDCIQEDILINHTSVIQVPAYPKAKGAFWRARKQLIGSSLVRHNHEKAESWMHRVTSDAVRAKIDVQTRRVVFNNVVLMILEAWPAIAVGGHDVSLWGKSESTYPHVSSLRDAYMKYFAEETKVAYDSKPFATLLSRAAWYKHERGESAYCRPLLELALKLCSRNAVGDTRDLESDIRYTLNAVANETNDAASCLEHTMIFLEIRQSVAAETGEVDERLARAHNERGIGWMMVKEYKKGEEQFATAAATYEKTPGYKPDMRSLALCNLGLARWLQGDLDQASSVLELGLADREQIYGYMDNHSFRTGRFLHALGNVRYSQGKVDESEEFHRRALKQYQSTIRNRHHRTADVCHKVAQHSLRHGNHEEAIGLLDQALKVWSIDMDKYAPEVARSSYLKAKALFAAGKEDEATRMFKTAASMRRKVTRHPFSNDRNLTEADFDELVTFWSR